MFRLVNFGLFVLVMCLLVSMAGCSTNIEPTPSAVEPESPLPSISNSHITIPVRLDLGSLARYVDENLSSEHGDKSIVWITGQGIGELLGAKATIQYGIHRAGPTTVTADGDNLLFRVPLAINSGRIDLEPGLWRPSVKHEFGGSANISARVGISVNTDWSLAVNTNDMSIDWVDGIYVDTRVPPIGPVPSYKLDVRYLGEPEIKSRLSSIAQFIQQQGTKLPSPELVERAWSALHQPVEFSKDPPLSLIIEPISMGVGALHNVAGELVIRPTVVAKLRLELGPSSRPLEMSALPPNTGTLGSDGVSMYVRVDAPYSELNSIAKEGIAGKTYEVGHGREITVKDVSLSAFGKQVLVRVDFAEAKLSTWPFNNVSGWVYLTGTPNFDGETSMLRIDEFDYDLNTQNLPAKVADWLLHERFVREIREKLVFDLSSKMNPVRARIEGGAQGLKLADGVHLNAATTDFQVSNLHVGKDAIAILATAKGEANIVVAVLPQ